MLEMCKQLLRGVSIDKELFTKELQKSLQWLSESEIPQLKDWCILEFRDQYADVLQHVFSSYGLS